MRHRNRDRERERLHVLLMTRLKNDMPSGNACVEVTAGNSCVEVTVDASEATCDDYLLTHSLGGH